MQAMFSGKKARILQQLSVPSSTYQDASPKGSVDEGIRALVDEINELDTLVTTSSCAGRIAVYLEGKRKGATVVETDAANAGAGGKGGGQWLYVSHDSVSEETQNHDLTTLFGMSTANGISIPPLTQEIRWVRCKFEPMILHILCRSIESAQRVQTAALGAGFRESGIASITTQPDGSAMVMTAVRTTGLAFDSVVGYESADGHLVPMVEESYMRVLVQLANERFVVNKERTERFREALRMQFSPHKAGKHNDDWEPTEVRKARLRAEGLARQSKTRGQADPPAREPQQHVDTDDAIGLGSVLR